MTDGNGNAGAAGGNTGGTPGAGGNSGQTWYQTAGVDAETVGHWQNKGWDVTDPTKTVLAATKAHREAERLIGMRADHDMLPIPRDLTKGDMNPVWERLGRPKEAKEYDFGEVKFKDGTALDDPFVEFLRDRAFKANLPKVAAADMAKGLVEFMETQDAREDAETAAALVVEKQALQKNWGANFEANKMVAQNAVRALGIDPNLVNTLEGTLGYAKVMEMFRNIGSKIGEDRFITQNGNGKGDNGVMTRDQAIARKNDLRADKAWVTKFLANDQEARREMAAIDQIISASQQMM